MKYKFTDYAFRIRFLDCSKLVVNWNNVFTNFFEIVLFLLPSLVTGRIFMSLSFTGSGVMRTSFYIKWNTAKYLDY